MMVADSPVPIWRYITGATPPTATNATSSQTIRVESYYETSGGRQALTFTVIATMLYVDMKT